MPSLEDFRSRLSSDFATVMSEYVMHIDDGSLDYVGEGEAMRFDEFKVVDITFEFTEPNVILMRATRSGESADNTISYLPWKNPGFGGVSKAELDDGGPPFFSTSQMNGCRFTIQFHDAGRKQATVLHLAGTYGLDMKGHKEREKLESANVKGATELRRRYSIGRFGGKHKQAIADAGRLYYGGNKASIFGFRDDGGVWHFVAQEMEESYGSADQALGVRVLG